MCTMCGIHHEHISGLCLDQRNVHNTKLEFEPSRREDACGNGMLGCGTWPRQFN